MKITRISLHIVPLKSHTAYYMADGKTCDRLNAYADRACMECQKVLDSHGHSDIAVSRRYETRKH